MKMKMKDRLYLKLGYLLGIKDPSKTYFYNVSTLLPKVSDGVVETSALCLITRVVTSGEIAMEIKLNEVTIRDIPHGDWRITVEQVKASSINGDYNE